MITKVIKLDINKNLYEKIKAKQGDTKSRFLLFQLLDGSMPFNLENRSVRAYMLKPDSTEVFNDLIINNRNTGHCTLELTNQVLAVAGIVKIELMIIENDKKITSSIFELQVDKSINSENSIVSTNEFNALLNGLASLSEYDNYKEKAKKVPELEENIQELGSQLEHKANEVDLVVERKRINNLIIHSGEGTEKDAEVVDLRVGADGETYDIAGNAIRKQISDVKSNISDSINVLNNDIYKVDINLIIGENAYGEGEDIIIKPQSNRARTGYISPIINNIKYKATDGFMVGYIIVGSDGKCVEDVAFKTTETDVFVESGNKIIFRCKKVDDSDMAQNDIPFHLYYVNESSINKIIKHTEIIFNGDRLNEESIKTIYGENAHGVDVDKLVIVKQDNRARSEIFKPKFSTVIITPMIDYLIGYTIVDKDNNVILDVTWKETEQIIDIDTNYNLVIRCKKYNDTVPDSNVKPFNISYIGKINTRVAELERKQKNSITINLSYYYEKGLIGYQTGIIGNYSTGFKHSRTSKFLKVVGGTPIKATYSIDTLYLYEYDKDKKFIIAKSLLSNTERKLDKSTVFIKFQHDNFTNGDVILTYYSPANSPVWEYNNRVNGNTIPFGYEVYPSYQTDVNDSVTVLNTKKVFTSGLLMLPPNYSEYGEKVPIIYFSHGSGDYQSILNTEFSVNYMDYIRYLCDEGFAIFDCYGWTDLYTTAGCQMANPTNMSAIKQGLKWVCDNYNVDNHVYVTGKSLGGLQAINMCYERDLPIKACCPIAPEIDATSIGFGYEKEGRKAYAKDLGFTVDTNGVLEEEGAKLLSGFSSNFKAYAKENAHKLQGYNPLWRNLLNADIEELIQYQIDADHLVGLPNKIKTMQRICEVPTKIIVAIDDRAVSHDLCSAYLQSIKNTGGVAELRSLPANTGGHHAVDNDPNALKVESITTKCGTTHTNVPLAYAEMVQFFRRYM